MPLSNYKYPPLQRANKTGTRNDKDGMKAALALNQSVQAILPADYLIDANTKVPVHDDHFTASYHGVIHDNLHRLRDGAVHFDYRTGIEA